MAKRRRRTPVNVTPRPLNDGENVRSIIRDELSKALALPPGAQTTSYSTEYLQSLQQRQQYSGAMSPLPRDPNVNAPFGPGLPLLSAPISPLQPSGRPAPRQWEYPVSWNLQTTTTRLVPWSVLRDVSDQVSVVRSCIDTCKATITSLDWSFSIDSRRARALAKRSGTSNHEVIVDLQDKFADDIERLHQWWARPNRGWTFTEWLSAVLEDELVCDAVCYAPDVEVLTENGWKLFKDVDIQRERFATRNPKTKAFEWQLATRYHEVPFDGDLLHFTSRSVDILVTPDHRMLTTTTVSEAKDCLPGRTPPEKFRTASEVAETVKSAMAKGSAPNRRIPSTSEWENPDFPGITLRPHERTRRGATGSAQAQGKPFHISGDDFAAFMGMYLSEGCVVGTREHGQFRDVICIAQKETSKGYGPYRELLARMLGREPNRNGGCWKFRRQALSDYLRPFGHAHEKYIPEIIREMSRRQLAIFWEYYMLGDGCYYGGREQIVTSSRTMADQLQEIVQKLGYSAMVQTRKAGNQGGTVQGRKTGVSRKIGPSREMYTVSRRTSKYQALSKVESVPYQGLVYCVSVPNETLYVRRNGKPAWCGNCLYPRLTLGGDLLAVEHVDASTIKPLLDWRGATPVPPLAAFQQILFGFPRGDYSASSVEDIDGEYADAVYGPIDFTGGARTDTLIYKVRNRRTQGPYGFSPVEASLPAVDLWLKRWDWLRSEYTSGVTPEMIVKVAGNMTPEQLRQYESVFNDDLSGRSDERHRARFLPDGFEPSYPDNAGNKFASDLDLHIIRLICAAFGVLPTSLGFTPNRGVGSMGASGHHAGEADAQLERSTKPRASWVVDLINEISINYLGMPPEVTFAFHGLDDEDEQKKATLLEGYVNNGLMVINEGRDHLNLPRFGIEQANEPFIATPTGPAFFNPGVQPVGMPGNLPSAPQNGQSQVEGSQRPAIEAGTSDAPRDEQVQDDGEGVKAEQKAFVRTARAYLYKRDERQPWRDHAFKSLSPDVAEAANRLAEAGDLDALKALFEMSAT